MHYKHFHTNKYNYFIILIVQKKIVLSLLYSEIRWTLFENTQVGLVLRLGTPAVTTGDVNFICACAWDACALYIETRLDSGAFQTKWGRLYTRAQGRCAPYSSKPWTMNRKNVTSGDFAKKCRYILFNIILIYYIGFYDRGRPRL